MSDDKWSARGTGGDGLGSLAQSARKSGLKQARSILIVVGVLTLLGNVVMFALAEQGAKKALEDERKNLRPGEAFAPGAEGEATQMIRLVTGGTAFLGVVFIALGILVYRAPVACTVTGLVLYLTANAIFAALDPVNLVSGIIIKVIIVVAMVKAIQAAIAYEREAKAEGDAGLDAADGPAAY